jgi:hypothetical protein
MATATRPTIPPMTPTMNTAEIVIAMNMAVMMNPVAGDSRL